MRRSITRHACHGRLAIVHALTCALVLPLVAVAQDRAAVPVTGLSQKDLDEIIVTGSLIPRTEFQYSSPISLFDATDLKASGVVSIDEFLKDQPSFTGFQYGVSTNNGNTGLKAVDLRGLGVKRTLVLINGRRQVGSFVGGPSEIGAVDLNTVPMFMLERVEVLKDGASTTYGSDALSGVVNFITRKNFEGAEISGDIAYASEDWDAKTVGINAVVGTSTDRGWVMAGAGYSEQRELLQGDRTWAKDALWPLLDTATDRFVPTPLGSSNARRIRGLSTAALDQIESVLGSRPTNYTVDEDTGVVRPFDAAADTYNYAPINAIVTPNETWNIGGSGEFNLVEDASFGSVDFFTEVMYTKRTSAQRLAPDASFAVDNDFLGTGQWNDFVPASNPYNPFGDTPNNPWGVSGEGVRLNRRFEESGGRRFIQEVDTFRIVAGLSGTLPWDIDWSAAYTFADNQETQETKFYHRLDRWRTMVDPALCGADDACVAAVGPDGFDPFGPFGSITPSELNYLFATSLKDISKNRMEDLLLTLNGEFGALEGGAIGWAAGYEARRDSAEYSPDEFSAQGLTTGGANSPLSGNVSVNEYFGELRLPLLADRPWVKALNIETAIRYSDFDTEAGSETTYRLGADWAINDEVRLRGVVSTGFRAPNIVELFGGNQTDFPVVEDPCEFYNRRPGLDPQIVANCIADGFPADWEWGFQYQAAFTQLSGATLEPEESNNYTLGVVWTPEFLPNFQASLDYFEIEVDDYIDVPEYSTLLWQCYAEVDRSTAQSCSYFVSGLGGRDSPPGDFGLPDDAEISLQNRGTLRTSGIDFALAYTRDVSWGPVQLLDLSLAGTWLNEYETEFPGVPTVDYVGKATEDSVFPEWRWNASAAVGADAWRLEYQLRFYGEADDFYRPPTVTDDAKAEDVLYHDLVGSYTWNNVKINVGIDNFTDEDPPRYHSAFNANTAPGTYDVYGRRFWTGFTLGF